MDPITKRKDAFLRRLTARGCTNYSLDGLGACYRNGRFDDAHFTAFLPCEPCMADAAMKGLEDPFTDGEMLAVLFEVLKPHPAILDTFEATWRNYRQETWDEKAGQR